MIPVILLLATSPSGANTSAILSALGLASGSWVTVGGTSVMHLRANEEILYWLGKNEATLTANGAKVHVYFDRDTTASARVTTLVGQYSPGQTGIIVGFSTEERAAATEPIRVFNRMASPGSGYVYEDLLLDGRTHIASTIALEHCHNVTLRNVWVLWSMRDRANTTDMPLQVCFLDCVNTRWQGGGIIGGQGNGMLGLVAGERHEVLNIHVAGDSKILSEMIGVYPGNQQQREATSGDSVWLANDNYRRWQPGTGLIGSLLNQLSTRLVVASGNTDLIALDWSIWTPPHFLQADEQPASTRRWFIKIEDRDVEEVPYVSGAWEDERVIVRTATPLPAGNHDVAYFCLLPAGVKHVTVRGCRVFCPTSDRCPASSITAYGGQYLTFEGNYCTGAADRAVGTEFCSDVVIRGNYGRSLGNDCEPVTFFGERIKCFDNDFGEINIVAHGCPVIDCEVRGGNTHGDDRNAGSTWRTGAARGSNVNMFLRTTTGRATNRAAETITVNACTVPSGSREPSMAFETSPS
jgi:hypothetical protein